MIGPQNASENMWGADPDDGAELCDDCQNEGVPLQCEGCGEWERGHKPDAPHVGCKQPAKTGARPADCVWYVTAAEHCGCLNFED